MNGEWSASQYRVVDCSLVLAEDAPQWPGTMPFQRKVWNWYRPEVHNRPPLLSRAPIYSGWMLLHEHAGTHFDSPAHAVPPEAGGVTGDRVAIERFLGEAAVIDLHPDTRNPGTTLLEEQHLAAWEGSYGPLRPGMVVLLRTGWDARYGMGSAAYLEPLFDAGQPSWPALSPQVLPDLLRRGIRTVGTDAPSIAPAHDLIAVHQAILGEGLVVIEALAHLDALPPRGAFFIFLPLLVQGCSGAPGWAVALVPSDFVRSGWETFP